MKITQEIAKFNANYFVGCDGFTVTYHDAIAAGIRWFELGWDKWSDAIIPTHAFKILGADETIEAFTRGVDKGSLMAYVQDPEKAVFVRKPILWTERMAEQFIKDAPSEMGKKYNFNLIAGMAGSNSRLGSILNAILGQRRFTHWIDKLTNSKVQAICSQTVARLNNKQPELRSKGCLGLDPDQEEVNPKMLFYDSWIYEPGAIELLPG